MRIAVVFEHLRGHLYVANVTLCLCIKDFSQNWALLSMRSDLVGREEAAAELAYTAFALSAVCC
jgi:hypothetical protein